MELITLLLIEAGNNILDDKAVQNIEQFKYFLISISIDQYYKL